MQQAKVGQWLVQVKPFPKLPPSERCTGLWNWLEKMPEDGEIQISSLNYTSTHGLDVGSVEVRYLEYRLEWLDIMIRNEHAWIHLLFQHWFLCYFVSQKNQRSNPALCPRATASRHLKRGSRTTPLVELSRPRSSRSLGWHPVPASTGLRSHHHNQEPQAKADVSPQPLRHTWGKTAG